MTADQVFKALGDPIRLELVQRLSRQPTYTIGKLSEGLGITRQGARKQIQVLESANIVSLEKSGRVTKVTLNKKSLEMGRAFITELEHQWDQRLQKLKQLTESA